MSATKIVLVSILCVAAGFLATSAHRQLNAGPASGQQQPTTEQNDPDLPGKPALMAKIDKESYLAARAEYIARLRGVELDRPFTLQLRAAALQQLQQQEFRQRTNLTSGNVSPEFAGPSLGTWAELGPRPIPNGQYQGTASGSVSGRATSVVVDPTNSNKVYLGTAQGGVWRSKDGGSTWTSIFDSAQSLAIGALALAPSDPTKLYVGTGEANNSADSFFGVGVYRIDNCDTTADLVGPINPAITTGSGGGAITTTCFTGRGITKILVHPTDSATIFVSTGTGFGGIGATTLSNKVPPLATHGVYRSTNATAAAASVTFTKLAVADQASLDVPGTGNTPISDMVFEPGNPANLLVGVSGSEAPGGGVFRSTNALDATPTFTQTLAPGATSLWFRLAINKVGSTVTAYVSSDESSSNVNCSNAGEAGRVRVSTDGGATWGSPLAAAEGFCGGQCDYDSPIAVDPSNASIVYLAGNARGTCSDVMKRTSNGGTTFTRDDTDLHADSHCIYIDPLTTPHTIWFANDGGIYSRQDAAAGTAWTSNNTTGLGTIQFQSVAVHPTDTNYTIGGTQDNGTEAQQSTSGTWVSAEGGDGGFALIDQSSTGTVNVTMYHTFYNIANSQILFDRATKSSCLSVKGSWVGRGPVNCGGGQLCGNDFTASSCDGTANYIGSNGIQLTDNVLFYAPMALGPGTPNVLYFGTDRLYRSTDKGDTMAIVSQSPIDPNDTRVPITGGAAVSVGTPISAIGIGSSSDNVRIVGLQNGQVWATTTGSSTLTNTNFAPPANANGSTTNLYVSRAVIDPNNSNTAYVTLAYYTNSSTAGNVWRTTNLSNAPPTWTSIGKSATGLPNIPVNAFAIDANDPTHAGVSVLYAGTDVGVFVSSDSGSTWAAAGPGLPRVAVFDLAIQPSSRILRAATHGRGMWELALPVGAATPTPSPTTTPTVTPTATPTATPIATATPTPTPTPTATPVATATPTATPVTTATPTATPVATATATPTPTPTATPAATATPTPTPAPTATPSATPPAQLLNISTRMEVQTGNNVLIGGFIVTGTEQKQVLVRGLGPSLPVGGALADPTLELHDANSVLDRNDNWQDTQASEIAATTIPPPNDLESAIVATLPANNSAYTAILAGKAEGTGVGLVEVYDLGQAAKSQLANISTRGFVDTGDDVMIGGVILGPDGSGPAKVLVRGIGPSLANAGVTNPLQDPMLELHDSSGNVVASNDDWKDSQQAEIEATTIPPSDDHESAIVQTLAPGNYTAIVQGKDSTTGVGLVELFRLE